MENKIRQCREEQRLDREIDDSLGPIALTFVGSKEKDEERKTRQFHLSSQTDH